MLLRRSKNRFVFQLLCLNFWFELKFGSEDILFVNSAVNNLCLLFLVIFGNISKKPRNLNSSIYFHLKEVLFMQHQ